MDTLFDGVYLKLARAEEHIEDVQQGIREYVETYLNDIVLEFDFDDWGVKGPGSTDVLDEVGLRAGDAIHNLRASLDYLAWALVDAHGASPDENIDFPLHLSRPTDGKPRNPLPLNLDGHVSPAALAEIERLQPYNTGHPSKAAMTVLGKLRELANVEKHRYLRLSSFTIGPGSHFNHPLFREGQKIRWLLEGHTENGALLQPADGAMRMYGHLVIQISIPESEPIGKDPPAFPKGDEPLVWNLLWMLRDVRNIADTLIPLA